MNSFRVIRNNSRALAVMAILMLITAIPALASAAQLTERSVALSSSSAGADDVTYDVSFTADGAAESIVIDFCENTPLIGQACTPPTGFSVSSATTSSVGYTINATETTANHIVVDSTITADEVVTFELAGVDNPDATGQLYARVVTYDLAASASGNYVSAADLGEGVIDTGSVAISITPTIGVSGAVLETMTFCVANVLLTENCGNADEPGNEPVLALGETVGDTVALVSGAVSEGSIYTQLSTNAANGAIIRLKSNALGCGGLLRSGAVPGTCDILPALFSDGGISSGDARFGVKLAATATPVGDNANGTLRAFPTSNYGSSAFVLNFTENDVSGVTSTYGDPILDTNDAPVNNQNMQLTFGASVSNDTPAGLYSADLSLIATGKF